MFGCPCLHHAARLKGPELGSGFFPVGSLSPSTVTSCLFWLDPLIAPLNVQTKHFQTHPCHIYVSYIQGVFLNLSTEGRCLTECATTLTEREWWWFLVRASPQTELWNWPSSQEPKTSGRLWMRRISASCRSVMKNDFELCTKKHLMLNRRRLGSVIFCKEPIPWSVLQNCITWKFNSHRESLVPDFVTVKFSNMLVLFILMHDFLNDLCVFRRRLWRWRSIEFQFS